MPYKTSHFNPYLGGICMIFYVFTFLVVSVAVVWGTMMFLLFRNGKNQ